MHKVTVINHAVLANAIAHLRKKTTKLSEFRHFSQIASGILLAEASFDLGTQTESIQTPLTRMIGPVLKKHIVLLPVLRAGLAMLPEGLTLFPHAQVGFAGLKRDEQTAVVSEYYWHVPKIPKDSVVFLLDPMLATGGSALHVLRKIQQENSQAIRLVSVIAAPEGIQTVQEEFPDVVIFTGVIDTSLNAQKFIVPGLGDFGDRYFGTD